MKTRLLLLLIAAATLCGCDRLGHRLTYYTYINATDKTVVVTLYDQDFYTDDWKVEVNPDAKEVFRFVIAPGEQYTRILQPYPGMGKKSFSPPFKDIEEAQNPRTNPSIYSAYSTMIFLMTSDCLCRFTINPIIT